MGPAVARVSAPRITPSLNFTPTMVVPVDVCRGSATPFCVNPRFLPLVLYHIDPIPLIIIEFKSLLWIPNSRHVRDTMVFELQLRGSRRLRGLSPLTHPPLTYLIGAKRHTINGPNQNQNCLIQ